MKTLIVIDMQNDSVTGVLGSKDVRSFDTMQNSNDGWQVVKEIDTLDKKLTAVLERNAELWERVNDEYDEKIAANEPDMTFERDEYDLAICGKSR